MRLSAPTGDPDVDLDAVDLFDARTYSDGDPHAAWRAMREHAPVHRQTLPDGRSFASVTRHADVSAVLRDHTRFTSRRGTLLSILGGEDPAGDLMMAASDPPTHTALREPLGRALSFAALRSRHPDVLAVVRRLIAPLAQEGAWDVAERGLGFPMEFTGALMGLPESDWPELARLTTQAVAPEDPLFGAEAGHGALVAAHHELFEYFAELAHRRDDRDDLVGFLKRMDVGGRRVRVEEVVYNCYSLLLGANVTTPHAVSATVQAFVEHPDEYARLTGSDRQTATAVEEGLRWASPANHFMRYATVDTELSGRPVRAGEAVVAWLGSANRDERVFADPYRFDVARNPNRHVAFGFGPHYCVGAPLARVALRMLFGELVRLVERFEAAGPVTHLRSNFVAGIRSLPVRAVLRPGAADELKGEADAATPAR